MDPRRQGALRVQPNGRAKPRRWASDEAFRVVPPKARSWARPVNPPTRSRRCTSRASDSGSGPAWSASASSAICAGRRQRRSGGRKGRVQGAAPGRWRGDALNGRCAPSRGIPCGAPSSCRGRGPSDGGSSCPRPGDLKPWHREPYGACECRVRGSGRSAGRPSPAWQ